MSAHNESTHFTEAFRPGQPLKGTGLKLSKCFRIMHRFVRNFKRNLFYGW